MLKRQIFIARTPDEIVDYIKRELITKAEIAIERNGVFRIGLSGGSLISYTTKALASLHSMDLTLWKFFFCDERYVHADNVDSIYGTYKRSLLTQTSNLKEEQFIHINTECDLNECAKDYENRLLQEFNMDAFIPNTTTHMPKFDMLLLGMGPDGHICSLFENHPLLDEKQKLIASINDSPKQPSERITMTLPLLNNAEYCLFVVTGKEKAKAIQRVFHESYENCSTSPLPSQLLTNVEQKWILDEDSAFYINMIDQDKIC